MKSTIKGSKQAHTNITVLGMIENMVESGYRGGEGGERSMAFERKILTLIRNEQHRLLGVMDRHDAKLMKAVQP